MAETPREIYQRYLWATLTQNADAVAEMFTVDGVFQAPLVRAGQAFPRHLEGREQIRTGLAEYYHRWAGDQQQAGLAGLTVNEEKSGWWCTRPPTPTYSWSRLTPPSTAPTGSGSCPF